MAHVILTWPLVAFFVQQEWPAPYVVSLAHMKSSRYWIALPVLLLPLSRSYSQCSSGYIGTPHTSSFFNAMLDPDGDRYITETGASFTSGTTEAAEFELIPTSVTGWVPLVDVSEASGDITPACGNADLITDDDGGDFAYYNVIDPTPSLPTSGDEYILFRFRLAKAPNGSFGYNFLIDTDQAYGQGIDGNTVCGNRGFEREVQFANAGGKKGVSVYDIDGSTTFSRTLCSQCVADTDVQFACAASSGTCLTDNPTFVTVPVPMVHLGVGSDINTTTFYVAMATANSGNATSVLGGNGATDMGAISETSSGCTECAGLTGCAEFDCQSQCINTAYEASLPLTFAGFSALPVNAGVRLQWSTGSGGGNAYFTVQHSMDGREWTDVKRVSAHSLKDEVRVYTFFHDRPARGSNYYRIRQTEFGGKTVYTDIRALELTAASESTLEVAPTLVTNGSIRVTLSRSTTAQGEIPVSVYNMSGRRVLTRMAEPNASVLIDTDGLAGGMYTVRTDDGVASEYRRFVKQ